MSASEVLIHAVTEMKVSPVKTLIYAGKNMCDVQHLNITTEDGSTLRVTMYLAQDCEPLEETPMPVPPKNFNVAEKESGHE